MKKFLLSAFTSLAIIANALSQNVGIGTTTSPIAKLEVRGDGNTSLGNNLVLRNLAGDTLFRVRNDGRMGISYNGTSFGRTMNLGGTGLNLYRTEVNFGGAIFPTDTSVVIWSDISDNKYVILQPSWGKVGIGTYSPGAMLHVNGPVILGNDGSVINNVIKASIVKNLVSIPSLSASIETFTITGANVGSAVSISPSLALPDGLLICYARVSASNTVEVKFMNVTPATINPVSMTFYISVVE